ncbi:unnamed protein product [Penicillium bialowiezense]
MVSATTASDAEAVSAFLTQLTFGYKVSPKAKEKEARENCANPRKEEARTCRHGIDGVLAGRPGNLTTAGQHEDLAFKVAESRVLWEISMRKLVQVLQKHLHRQAS